MPGLTDNSLLLFDISVQFIGFIALLLSFTTFQMNKRSKILLFQMSASIFWTIHFYLLGGYTGAILNFLCIIRCMVYAYQEKKNIKNSIITLAFFCVISPILCLLTWENLFSLFPCVAMILTSISFYVKNPKHIRFLTFPSSPLWIIYNIINKSYPGIITESFVMISIAIAILRFDVFGKTTDNNMNK